MRTKRKPVPCLAFSTSRMRSSKKSVLMSRSCTSSMITWLTPSSVGSCCSLLSSTPVVQNSTLAPQGLGGLVFMRTRYPTLLPSSSPRSLATRAATAVAASLLGCVTTTRQLLAVPAWMASSKMYCGICVVLPLPVPPLTTTTASSLSALAKRSRSWLMGRSARSWVALGPTREGSAAKSCFSHSSQPSGGCGLGRRNRRRLSSCPAA
mmetsp:Transcript_10060/g.19851  ORF Transcript_10060/g.19851 Transcript_10060/m.19851 type:complete len:208 (+) Transcript_10060:1102-1725(+)